MFTLFEYPVVCNRFNEFSFRQYTIKQQNQKCPRQLKNTEEMVFKTERAEKRQKKMEPICADWISSDLSYLMMR
jgi:hypothetical protein